MIIDFPSLFLAQEFSTGSTGHDEVTPPPTPSMHSGFGLPSSCFRRKRFFGPYPPFAPFSLFLSLKKKKNYHKREEGRQRKEVSVLENFFFV